MSFAKLLTTAYLAAACTGLSNTGSEETLVGQNGEEEGADEPTERDDETDRARAIVSSRYRIASTFSIPASAAAPAEIYELLTELSEEPGRAILHVADAAGVPAAERLFDALPNALSSRIGEWMTDAISSDELSSVRSALELSQQILTDVEVESVLDIEEFGDADTARAHHTLSSVSFSIGEVVIEEDVPQISSLPGAGHAELMISVAQDGDRVRLAMGEHRFGLLLGEAAFRAFESKLQSATGKGLRGNLGDAVDCSSVAQDVAAKCVLGVCVGHAEELTELCEVALDEVAEKVYEQFLTLDTEVLRLTSGDAEVVETPAGTRLVGGLWQAEADFGIGMRELPSSFTAESF